MHHRVSLNGYDLHYVTNGTSDLSLVLLHGLNSSTESYRHIMESVADVARVFAFDLRGHGLSAWVNEPYTIKAYASDLVEFIKKIVGRPVVIAGHSLGGLVGAYIAARHSNLVRGLVLEDPPMFKAQMPALKETGFYSMFVYARDLLRSHHDQGATVDDLVPTVGGWPAGDGKSLLEAMGEDFVRQLALELHQSDPDTLNAPLEGFLFDDFNPQMDLASISCPTHLIAANVERGGTMDQADIDMIVSLISNCTHVVWDDAGHEVHLEFPQRYRNELLRFLETLDNLT